MQLFPGRGRSASVSSDAEQPIGMLRVHPLLLHTDVYHMSHTLPDVDIAYRQLATARFISRHLYNFFVADEPQVPAWETVPPGDPEAVDTLAKAFISYEYDIRSVLRVLFNSDFCKSAAYAKVNGPVELAVGTVRLAGGHRFLEVADVNLGEATRLMGQELLDPPSVEGWHTGAEWMMHGSPGIVNRPRRGWREPANAASALATHACPTATGPLRTSFARNSASAPGKSLSGGQPRNWEWATKPRNVSCLPDKIARQLTLTFSLDNNISMPEFLSSAPIQNKSLVQS